MPIVLGIEFDFAYGGTEITLDPIDFTVALGNEFDYVQIGSPTLDLIEITMFDLDKTHVPNDPIEVEMFLEV